ncbi:MAG: hypothetical protein LIO93_09570 [Bacteroidales bacterium]|nr:hypothetical protein [Bacteroidales bacterium]
MYSNKEELPNATLILILGISSLVGCCFSYGVIGLVCAIIALVLSKNANDLYVSNPERFTESSYKNMQAGKTCAIISLILSIILLLFTMVLIFTLGWAVLANPGTIIDQYNI